MPRNIKITGINDTLSKDRSFRKLVNKVAEDTLKEKLGTLTQQIENHPVSKELRAGVTASNTSGTLGGYGNLYTFLGGFEGDVVSRIVSNILVKAQLGRERVYNNEARKEILFTKELNVPLESIDETLTFENRGVIDAVENGVGNFSHFVYSRKRLKESRTGHGLQSEKSVRTQQFVPTEWIGSLLRQLK